jgi:hypothetical protein
MENEIEHHSDRLAYKAINVPLMQLGEQADESNPSNVIRKYSPQQALFWTLLYIPGVIVGLAELISLVIQEIRHNPTVERITLVFGTVVATLAVLSLIAVIIISDSDGGLVRVIGWSSVGFLFGAATTIGILGPLYSDWILGAIAQNLAGTPSSDNALLYWCYFVAKRLPFFSF